MNHEQFEEIAALDAVGAATAEQRASLERHLAECSSCAGAAAEYNDAAALIALGLEPRDPPAEARHQILNSIGANAETTLTGWRSRRRKPMWWLATAATFFIALWGWSELRVRTVRHEVEELRASKRTLEEDVRRLRTQNQRLGGTLETIGSPDTRTISLAGQEIAPSASARVYLDSRNRRAFVFFNGLPAVPGDKNYQLWIIRADSPNPQPAGVFNVNAQGQAQLSVENLPVGTELKALAVTLEPRGGVPAPTGARYLVGTSG